MISVCARFPYNAHKNYEFTIIQTSQKFSAVFPSSAYKIYKRSAQLSDHSTCPIFQKYRFFVRNRNSVVGMTDSGALQSRPTATFANRGGDVCEKHRGWEDRGIRESGS